MVLMLMACRSQHLIVIVTVLSSGGQDGGTGVVSVHT